MKVQLCSSVIISSLLLSVMGSTVINEEQKQKQYRDENNPWSRRRLQGCCVTQQFEYDLEAYIPSHLVSSCSSSEAQAIGANIDYTVQRVFRQERIIYDSNNWINHSPRYARRQLLEQNRTFPVSNLLLTNQSNALFERKPILQQNDTTIGIRFTNNVSGFFEQQGQAEEERRSLRYSFVYHGGGRCRLCNYDDRDTRNLKEGEDYASRRLSAHHTWNWVQGVMEPKASQESTNSVNNEFRNKPGHCLQGQYTTVSVSMHRTN